MDTIANLIYYGGLSYIIPIAVYWTLGVEGDWVIGKRKFNWDWLIFIPIINIIGLIAIIWELIRALYLLCFPKK